MFLFKMNYFITFWVFFFALMAQSFAFCFGIKESKHVGKDIHPMPSHIMIQLTGIFSDSEREKLMQYFSLQLEDNINASKAKQLIALLKRNNDSPVIQWCIQQKIDLASILGLSYLRYKMICSKQFLPWFLKEIALLPVICGCLKNCLINPLICKNVSYLMFLIDQLERNHHRIETESDDKMLADALIIINNQLDTLRQDSSHIHKKLIDQAVEKLILIEEMHTLSHKTLAKNISNCHN